VSSSDEFNDPFSEDTGGGLLEMEGDRNIQDTKVAKWGEKRRSWIADRRKSRIRSHLFTKEARMSRPCFKERSFKHSVSSEDRKPRDRRS